MLATGVRLEQFDPAADSARLRACHQIMEAARPIDHPALPPQSSDGFANWWGLGEPQQSWLASDDSGEPVGCYRLMLPERENTAVAFCGLVVSPARRRAGAGTALLAHLAAQASRAGRSRLAIPDATRLKPRDGSAGAAFAAAAGASGGLAEHIRTQEISADLLARLPGLRADADQHAVGYELLSWSGAIPDEQAGPVARVRNALADAPRDAGVQPQIWDAGRVRAAQASVLAHGLRLHSVAARPPGTGDIAALTQVTTDPQTPGWATQQLTAVLPEHRGHRLGLLVKIAMLELLSRQEPGIRRVLTGNAESNEHMSAINAQLGYQLSATYRAWELDLRPDV